MRDVTRVDCAEGVVDLSRVSFQSIDFPSKSVGGEIFACTSIDEIRAFIAARDSLPSRLHGFVSPYTAEDYLERRARLFLTADERGGFAIIGDELASLFSLPGAHYGDILVASSVLHGAERLSCYDNHGKLFRLYSRHGFTEVLRVQWDDAFAPADWDYEAWGRPDYVEMKR